MKHIIITLLALVISSVTSIEGQVKETFDYNSWQWTEYSGEFGKAYIIEGVMRLESKSDKSDTSLSEMVENVATHAYLPMDPLKGFLLKCSATVEKFEGKKQFGIILDYFDDMNCMVFMIKGDFAYLYRIKEGHVTSRQKNQFKLQKGKKQTTLDIEVSFRDGELEFRVNDVQALWARNQKIESNGFGFFAFGKAKVDFDDVEIFD